MARSLSKWVRLTQAPVEFATVGKTKDGKVYHHLWGADDITTLLKEHGLAKEEDADAG